MPLTEQEQKRLEELRSEDRRAPRPPSVRPVVLVAGSAFLIWLALLPLLCVVAQLLYRPEGVESLGWVLESSWELMLLPLVAGISIASAAITRSYGNRAGWIFLSMSSALPAYQAYHSFVVSEQALVAHLWTASAIGGFFARLRMYPAAAVSAFAALLVVMMLDRRA